MLKMLTPRDKAAILTLTVKLVMLFSNLRSIKAQDVNCDNNPCFNGGTCLRGVTSDSCQCPPSRPNSVYIQPFCTRSCGDDGFSCRNGGTCSNHVCNCPFNTAGPYCESVVKCDNNPCFNGGTCMEVLGFPSCQCQNAVFIGPFCTRSCEVGGFSCQNGGTCFNHVCVCPSNTAGPQCESVVNCDNNPCFNGGTCMEGFSSIWCQCPPPSQNAVYIQPFCTRSCEEDGFSCQTGGTCLNHVCVCPSNIAGPYCESAPFAYLTPLTVYVSEADGAFTTIQVCRRPATQFASFVVDAMPFSADAQDYFLANADRTVRIAVNTQCSPVTISVIDDQRCESAESFTLSLSPSNPSHSIVLEQDTATIFILDDDSAPTITCPSDITAYSPIGTQQTTVQFGSPVVSDSSATITASPMSGSTFTVGTRTVFYTATDAAGCTASCTFTVTVIEDIDECSRFGGSSCTTPDICMNTVGSYQCECGTGFSGAPYGPGQQRTCRDIESPVFTSCPDDIYVGVEAGMSSSTQAAFWSQPRATDNLGAVTLTSSHQPGQSFSVGTETTVTYTATDAAGNLAECVFTVTVMTITIQCPGRMTIPAGSALPAFTNPDCIATHSGIVTSSSDCSVPSGIRIPFDVEVICKCEKYSNIECAFMVVVTGAPVTIECPNDVMVQRNSPLTYSSPQCHESDRDTTSGSSCTPASPVSVATSDIEVTCKCLNYQSVQCTFMVIIKVYVDCPVSGAQVYAGDQLSFSSPSCIFMGRSSPSTCNPSSGSRVFEETSVTCTCDDHPDAQCQFRVNPQMMCAFQTCGEDSCYCEEATCSDVPGVCSSGCRTFGCPLTIRSQSVSQVNPQSSVEIKCILEGSVGVPSQLSIRLSRSKDRPDATDFGDVSSSGQTGNTRESTATVQTVSEDDIFYCILSQSKTVIGSVNVTGFVYKLPSILDPPTEVRRSPTSITISWRPWVHESDVGDPPVVAYIPQYKMDSSQDWINGSLITPNQLLEYTASDLEADRFYTFSVVTVREGEGGEGPRGPPITIKTYCIELMAQSVSSSITTSDDVSVSWEAPENVDCRTGITNFTVYYALKGDTNIQMAGTTNGTSRSFIVDGSLLESGTTYNFYVTITTDQEGALSQMTENSQLLYNNKSEPPSPVLYIIGFVAFFIVILVMVLLIVIVIRKRRKDDSTEPVVRMNDIDGKSSISGTDNHIYSNPPLSMPVPDDPQGDGGVDEYDNIIPEAEEASKVEDIYGNLEPPAPIKISAFPEYIVNNADNLEHEFLILNGANQIHPWTVAELPVHKRKNRFKNMYPYDHSRVVLNRLPDQDHSDYYNASYIVNERNEKTYIACQAPNKASIDDFWRMIFEQKVQTIAMLTNLYEEGKDRCLRYWPNNESETQSFGYINVTWEKTQLCANYDVRTLSVDRGGKIQQIEQLHFKAWPDKLVPDDAISLIEFAKHCKLLHHGKSSPLLVHCSAGIGRSGTFIALYTMMDVLHTEEYIDVFSYINKIREDRINMVQTKEQYRYLHTCLYEYYLTKDCQVSANALSHLKLQDSKASIVMQFELLSELETTGAADTSQGSSSKNRKSTNRDRFGNMVPLMKNRVFLMSMSPSNPDNYINASFVKSFEKKDAFITTQSPLPNTIEDFWRMVYDHKCRTLVMLNQLDSSDKTCVQYWPDRGSLDYGIMTVTCIATEHQPDYIKRKFDITINNSEEVLSVTHVQFTAWPPQCSAKSTIDAFIDIEKMKQEENDTKPLVVHCINGFEQSGVLVTVLSEMERIRATGKVDVFTTVKKLRSEHQHMLRKKMDYILCFELLILFTQKFGNYENW